MATILSPAGDALTVFLTGEIDHHAAASLREEIDAAIEAAHPQILTLDFGGVSFMDSSGIGLVMGRYKLIASYGGRIVLANIPKPLRRAVRLAGLDRLATIEKGDRP